MTPTLFSLKCEDCGGIFTAVLANTGSYGELILYSRAGNAAWLNALEDPVFDEVTELVKAHPDAGKLDDVDQATVLHAVFSVACDPDPEHHRYVIGGMPPCPNCKSQKIESWEPVGALPAERSIPHVTHAWWNGLSPEEKRSTVHQAIDHYLL